MRLIPPIRLSTAVLLMFVAGGWIWLNTRRYEWKVPEPYQVGLGSEKTERWVETVTLKPNLQNDSPLMPGFTLIASYRTIAETRTRLISCSAQGFPFAMTDVSNFTELVNYGRWRVTGIVVRPFVGNVVVGLVMLWMMAMTMAYFDPLKSK